METAKHLMQELRHAEHANQKEAKIAELLALFQQYPELVSEKLYYQFNYMTPLHAFILNDASLQAIKQLCSLVPDVKEMLGARSEEIEDRRKGECALNAAYRHATHREDLILFLAEQQPRALTRKGFQGEMVVHSAMESRNLSDSTLRRLLELSPTSGFDEILNVALRNSFPLDMVDMIISRKKTWSVEIRASLNPETTTLICNKLIPRLRRFDIHDEWDSNQTFMRVVQAIRKANKVSEIRWLTLAPLNGIDEAKQTETIRAVQSILEGNMKLTSVTLGFPSGESMEGKETWCHSILSSVPKMPNLRSLSIGGSSSRSFYSSSRSESEPAYLAGACEACLRLVQENLVLRTCSPWDDWDGRVKHYLKLNKHGRAVARDASADQMVDILFSFELYHDWEYSREDDKGLSILYGLLRETPGSWCKGVKVANVDPARNARAGSKKRRLSAYESLAVVRYRMRHGDFPWNV